MGVVKSRDVVRMNLSNPCGDRRKGRSSGFGDAYPNIAAARIASIGVIGPVQRFAF